MYELDSCEIFFNIQINCVHSCKFKRTLLNKLNYCLDKKMVKFGK